jgi:molecular chaperone DnaK
VEGKIAALRSAMQGEDTDYIRRTVQELSEAMQKVGASVYQQTGAPPGGQAPPEGGPQGPQGQKPDEGTVEGEFREV